MAKSNSFRISGIEWRVANVLSVSHLESDEFTVHESRWRLRLSPSVDRITVYLDKLNSEKLIGRYPVRSFVQGRNGESLDIVNHIWSDTDIATKAIWWNYTDHIRDKSDTYLNCGTLTFVVVFKCIMTPEKDVTDEKGKSSQTSVNMDRLTCLENLSLDLQNILDGGTESDVTLKCGKRSFPAHRIILSARSEVFSAMFRSGMLESHSGIVQITDVDASVLDQLMRYIYSGDISDLSIENAPALCVAADKYRIEFLKNMCVKFIRANLTRENACKMLVFADVIGCKDLKDSVMRFIMSVELLRNKDIWNRFLEEHPKLATEVIHHAYAAKCDLNAHDASSA